jgi:23S rRNA pseudouridine2457 synthase
MPDIILLNKPFNVLSQFTDSDSQSTLHSEKRTTLANFINAPGFRAAGRLDYDSEGLLLLTDDGQLQNRIASPRHKLPKTYWVQVEGTPTQSQLTQLAKGVELNDGMTLPAQSRLLENVDLWPRDPPIRHRLTVPTAWIELTISEGRNRQVRRMTAAVGLPTLRLVRVSIGDWRLDGLLPGEFRRIRLPATHKPQTADAKIERHQAPAQRKSPHPRRRKAQSSDKPV